MFGNLVLFPVDVIRGFSSFVLGTVDVVVGGVTNLKSIGGPKDEAPERTEGSKNVYDIAKPMLNVANLIYPVVQIRRRATQNLEKKISKEDMKALKNAWYSSVDILKKIKEGSSSNKNTSELVDKYRHYLNDCQVIRKRLNLTEGEFNIITHDLNILHLPKTAADLKSDITINFEYLTNMVLKEVDDSVEYVQSAIDQSPAELVYIDDDFTTADRLGFEGELVYGILVNKEIQQIIVVCRGSVGANDWLHNLKGNMTNLEIPRPGSTSYGLVHRGFYQYLFGETKKGSTNRTISKQEEIMGRVRGLLEQYPGFKVSVTGHSLGGSLSTLVAFGFALQPWVPKPVLNVSWASPFVGDVKFRKSFQKLEAQRKIQHLRMANDDDVVPMISPTTVPIPWPLPGGERYRHVGMNIQLYQWQFWNPKRYRILFPKPGSVVSEINRAIRNSILLGFHIPSHFCPEYRKRFEAAEEGLQLYTLDGLYKDPEVVGSL